MRLGWYLEYNQRSQELQMEKGFSQPVYLDCEDSFPLDILVNSVQTWMDVDT